MDVDTLFDFIEEKKIKFDDLFKVKEGQHPQLNFILPPRTIETMLILDELLNYTKRFNKTIKEKVICA